MISGNSIGPGRETPWSFSELAQSVRVYEDYNFDNLADYDWYSSRFASLDKKQLNRSILKEPEYMVQLDVIWKMGLEVLYDIYSYRGCAPGIPQVKEASTSSKLHNAIYHVMRPEIERLTRYMSFFKSSTEILQTVIRGMVENCMLPESIVSPDLMTKLSQVIGLCLGIDVVKRTKGSIANDLSIFKRAVSNISVEVLSKDKSNDLLSHLQALTLYMAQQDNFCGVLTPMLSEKITGMDAMIQEILIFLHAKLEQDTSLNSYQNKNFLLLALTLILFIWDSNEESQKQKKIRADRIANNLMVNNDVLIYGDVSCCLSNHLSRCPRYEQWTSFLQEYNSAEYFKNNLILHCQISNVRVEYKTILQLIRKSLQDRTHNSDMELLADRGLNFLFKTKDVILKQHLWKLNHPNNDATTITVFYEKVVKSNYSPAELEILVEIVAMQNNIRKFFDSSADVYQSVLQKRLIQDCQHFCSETLTPLYHHLQKKKKSSAGIISYILEINETSKDSVESTQMFLTRAILADLINPKSKAMKSGFMQEKDLKDSQVESIRQFLDKSWKFSTLFNLQVLLHDSCDLSFLWFREYHMGLSNSIEIPLSSSIIYILSQAVFKSKNVTSIRLVFDIFSIYNSAAFAILQNLKGQYLYDEIEAECNMMLNEILHVISHRIYHLAKIKSARSLIASKYLKDVNNSETSMEEELALKSLLRSQTLQVLGHIIPVNDIISSQVSNLMHKSLEIAITRFESHDLTYIKEFENMILVNQETHNFLSAFLTLDPFQSFLKIADDGITLLNNSRVVDHILHELIRDVVPNYCYNQSTGRFTKCSILFSKVFERRTFSKSKLIHLYGSKDLTIAFGMQNSAYRDILGDEHWYAVLRHVGMPGLSEIIQGLLQHANILVEHMLSKTKSQLFSALPKSLKLPLFEYGTTGTFEYFLAHLKELNAVPNLKSEIFQTLREIGNCFLIVQRLQCIIETDSAIGAYLFKAAHYPNEQLSGFPHIESDLKGNTQMEYLKNNPLANPYKADFTKNFITCLESSLEQIFSKDIENSISNTDSFSFVWCCLRFLFCLNDENQISHRELFGDGWLLAGCLISHALGQKSPFQAMDMNAHLLAIKEEDQNFDNYNASSKMSDFLKNAEIQKQFTYQFYGYLQQ